MKAKGRLPRSSSPEEPRKTRLHTDLAQRLRGTGKSQVKHKAWQREAARPGSPGPAPRGTRVRPPRATARQGALGNHSAPGKVRFQELHGSRAPRPHDCPKGWGRQRSPSAARATDRGRPPAPGLPSPAATVPGGRAGPGLPRPGRGPPPSPRCRQCSTWQCCPMSNSAIAQRREGAGGSGGGASVRAAPAGSAADPGVEPAGAGGAGLSGGATARAAPAGRAADPGAEPAGVGGASAGSSRAAVSARSPE